MNEVELPERWLPRWERDPGRTLARAALGFTAYLAEPEFSIAPTNFVDGMLNQAASRQR